MSFEVTASMEAPHDLYFPRLRELQDYCHHFFEREHDFKQLPTHKALALYASALPLNLHLRVNTISASDGAANAMKHLVQAFCIDRN